MNSLPFKQNCVKKGIKYIMQIPVLEACMRKEGKPSNQIREKNKTTIYPIFLTLCCSVVYVWPKFLF